MSVPESKAMKLLLDTHDLVRILERGDSCDLMEFADFLAASGHTLVVSTTVVKEIAAPLVERRDASEVFQTLRKLEDLPVCYFNEAKAVYEELSRAAVAFNENEEPQRCTALFSDRIDRALPLWGRVETEFYLNYSLSEAVWELWQTHPELLKAPRDRGAALRHAIQKIRSELQKPGQSVTDGFVVFAQEAVALYQVPVEIPRFKAFARWLWASPWRCPAVRMAFEVRHELVLNADDKVRSSDIFDLTYIEALPYVDGATLDRRMRHYVQGATRRLPDRFCAIVYTSFAALLAEGNAEPLSGADAAARFAVGSPLTS